MAITYSLRTPPEPPLGTRVMDAQGFIYEHWGHDHRYSLDDLWEAEDGSYVGTWRELLEDRGVLTLID